MSQYPFPPNPNQPQYGYIQPQHLLIPANSGYTPYQPYPTQSTSDQLHPVQIIGNIYGTAHLAPNLPAPSGPQKIRVSVPMHTDRDLGTVLPSTRPITFTFRGQPVRLCEYLNPKCGPLDNPQDKMSTISLDKFFRFCVRWPGFVTFPPKPVHKELTRIEMLQRVALYFHELFERELAEQQKAGRHKTPLHLANITPDQKRFAIRKSSGISYQDVWIKGMQRAHTGSWFALLEVDMKA
ncbi:hypothetical protein JAAARDRAFT_191126 [Jaapia argillacea MUCL 33604]|uniref:Uncharacterized protein n=1 Tax=Jaapia argillacea MUCL 33604 TaxID=933084 RepID=A0A067Q4D2_9AGAM|nr:hypothetical protein JAAARDRAFT_191126 [Jaapia argillacea MUCL 33604]